MADSGGEINCSVAHEKLSSTGEVLQRNLYKNGFLTLGRNEFKDIMLKIECGKKSFKVHLRDIVIHKKFARDGKATLKLVNESMQFMLSNCPPDKLIMFLRILSTKLECLKLKGCTSERKRLFSELPNSFQEISPLTIKDIETVSQKRAEKCENNTELFTPKAKKRRTIADKENPSPQTLRQKSGTMTSFPKPKVRSGVLLTAEQKRVLQHVAQGLSIFFTGSAGTGKSLLLKKIIGALPPHETFATASTGVAACHIGGTTLHAFAGIGSGTSSVEHCIELASRAVVAQQWRRCQHLIIDEISMVDGNFFEKLEAVARAVRKSEKPFGGIQLILCGDFLQLPPVTRQTAKRKYAFQSRAWGRCIQRCLELTEVKRQSDASFISLLQHIRHGRCPESVVRALQETRQHTIESGGILATRLCTHKEDVHSINTMQLDKLKGESRLFEACDSDPGLVRLIDAMCPVEQSLQLKVGAQVMLAKNLDIQRGLVNGARGVVVGFEPGSHGAPRVRFVCGETMAVKTERWTLKGGATATELTRRQLPLKLAWAISIHKSQGMTLDCVEISLARVFECGQAYVALSRARHFQGLRVLDFHSGCVKADPDVLKFYAKLPNHHTLSQPLIPTGQL